MIWVHSNRSNFLGLYFLWVNFIDFLLTAITLKVASIHTYFIVWNLHFLITFLAFWLKLVQYRFVLSCIFAFLHLFKLFRYLLNFLLIKFFINEVNSFWSFNQNDGILWVIHVVRFWKKHNLCVCPQKRDSLEKTLRCSLDYEFLCGSSSMLVHPVAKILHKQIVIDQTCKELQKISKNRWW